MFPQVGASHFFVGEYFLGIPLGQYRTFGNDIGALANPQGFPYIVIRDQYANPGFCKICNDLLYI